jgi:hypothetical protein
MQRPDAGHPAKPIFPIMLSGSLIGLLVISAFIFPASAKPEWGKFWFVKPLVLTPLVTAIGSLSFYLAWSFWSGSKSKNAFLLLASTAAFLVALWLGIVLGLNGTLWD